MRNSRLGMDVGLIQGLKLRNFLCMFSPFGDLSLESFLPNVFILSKFWGNIYTWGQGKIPFENSIPMSSSITY